MDDTKRAVWELCGNGWVDVMLAAMNGITAFPVNALNNRNINMFETWLFIQTGQTGAVGLVFPSAVYQTLTTAVEGFKYGNSVIGEAFSPPTNFVIDGTTITVDENTSQEEYKKDFPIKLWGWNSGTKVFTKSELTGSVAGGTVTFTGVPAGYYVCAVDDSGAFNSFPTVWKQVS